MVGRKRHILVDVEGIPVAMRVHSAGIQDRKGLHDLLDVVPPERTELAHLWADSGYTGTGITTARRHGLRLEVVRRTSENTYRRWQGPQMKMFKSPRGFTLVRRRWVVERTFAWLSRNRRLSKDYEGTIEASEGWLWVAALRMLTGRLAH